MYKLDKKNMSHQNKAQTERELLESWERIPSFTKKQVCKAGVEAGSEPEWSASDRTEMTGAGTCRENRRNKEERIEVQRLLKKSSVLVKNEKQGWQNIVNGELKNDVFIRRTWLLRIMKGNDIFYWIVITV